MAFFHAEKRLWKSARGSESLSSHTECSVLAHLKMFLLVPHIAARRKPSMSCQLHNWLFYAKCPAKWVFRPSMVFWSRCCICLCHIDSATLSNFCIQFKEPFFCFLSVFWTSITIILLVYCLLFVSGRVDKKYRQGRSNIDTWQKMGSLNWMQKLDSITSPCLNSIETCSWMRLSWYCLCVHVCVNA